MTQHPLLAQCTWDLAEEKARATNIAADNENCTPRDVIDQIGLEALALEVVRRDIQKQGPFAGCNCVDCCKARDARVSL